MGALLLVVCAAVVGAVAAFKYPFDYLCNNGTHFACVCYETDQSLRSYYDDCLSLVGERQLNVVRLEVKRLLLTATMYTGEPYEAYFRRRVARTLSRHCEADANACPGTTLQITQDRVIILRMQCETADRTVLKLVVAKTKQMRTLYQVDLLSSAVVADVLEARKTRLGVELGGVGVVSARTERLVVIPPTAPPASPPGQNFGLTVVMIVIGISLCICYIIAIYKVVKDYRQKKRAEKLTSVAQKSYGATNATTRPPKPSAVASLDDAGVKSNGAPTADCFPLPAVTIGRRAPSPPIVDVHAPTTPPRVTAHHFEFFDSSALPLAPLPRRRSLELPVDDARQVVMERSSTAHQLHTTASTSPSSGSEAGERPPNDGYHSISPCGSVERMHPSAYIDEARREPLPTCVSPSDAPATETDSERGRSHDDSSASSSDSDGADDDDGFDVGKLSTGDYKLLAESTPSIAAATNNADYFLSDP